MSLIIDTVPDCSDLFLSRKHLGDLHAVAYLCWLETSHCSTSHFDCAQFLQVEQERQQHDETEDWTASWADPAVFMRGTRVHRRGEYDPRQS